MIQSKIESSHSYKGYFLTLEGGDGAGKSTLIKGLSALLQELSIPLLATAEPGGCDLGNAIRKLALSSSTNLDMRAELGLFLAARAQHVSEVLLPALHAGQFVICDRFHDSTIAYQGYGRQLGAAYVTSLSHFFAQQLIPERTFYCAIAPAEALLRLKKAEGRVLDRLESEAQEYHERVYAGFCTLAAENAQRIFKLDAKLPPEKLLEQAIQFLQPCIATWKARQCSTHP